MPPEKDNRESSRDPNEKPHLAVMPWGTWETLRDILDESEPDAELKADLIDSVVGHTGEPAPDVVEVPPDLWRELLNLVDSYSLDCPPGATMRACQDALARARAVAP